MPIKRISRDNFTSEAVAQTQKQMEVAPYSQDEANRLLQEAGNRIIRLEFALKNLERMSTGMAKMVDEVITPLV